MRYAVRAPIVIACGLLGGACSLFTSLDGLQSDDGPLGAAGDGALLDVDRADVPKNDAQSESGGDGNSGSLYAAAVIADHPVAYWRLGEASAASLMKDQIGVNDGAYTSSAALGVPGAIANDPDTAVKCDGMNPVASVVGDALNFVGTAPMSIELWMMPTMTDGNPRFMVTKEASPSGPREGWSALFTSDQMNFERVRDGNFDNINTTNVALNVYNHIVFTFDGSTVVAYANGAQSGSGGFTESLVSTTSSVVLGFGGGTGLVGSLDEVAIYDHALGADRVLAHYKIGKGL